MQAPIARQRVRTIKELQQGLSLPIIPQKTPSSPRTSTHSRRNKHSIPCISQATLSPEEEHLQDQIRMILHNSPKINHEHLKTHEYRDSKRHKPMLPPLANNQNHSKKGENAYSAPSTRERSKSAKADLDIIIREQSNYIDLYFAQLSAKKRR